ncbi:MAG TPA: hypothetical protein VNO30_37620 [Kofleriaceae bacterium]|nr:hypothetical protein [Kofleriaceae bacterium]
MSARRLLDQVSSLAHLDAFDPPSYAVQLAAEVPLAETLAELEARDALLADALAQLDAMIARAMRLCLEDALAADTSIGTPTRKVFATTVVAYASDLGLLAERAREVAVRGRAADPDAVAGAVVGAARRVLDLRAAARADVLALIRDLAAASVAGADRLARDRRLDEPTRRRWSAMRRELEAIAAAPARLAAAPLAGRLASHPDQLDEPAPEPEVTLADMIELD